MSGKNCGQDINWLEQGKAKCTVKTYHKSLNEGHRKYEKVAVDFLLGGGMDFWDFRTWSYF